MIKFGMGATFVGIVIAAVVCGPAQAELITSVPDGNVTLETGSLGVSPPGTSIDSFGQVIEVPAINTNLESFSFWLKHLKDGPPADHGLVSFRAYVMAWDAATTRATGSILYLSDTTIGPTSIAEFTKYTWSTGGINLNAGEDYVLFLSVYGEDNLHDWQRANLGTMSANVYPGGGRVFQDSGNNYTTEAWNFSAGDLAFDAVFTPEPSTLALAAFGLAALGAWGWRRKRRGD